MADNSSSGTYKAPSKWEQIKMRARAAATVAYTPYQYAMGTFTLLSYAFVVAVGSLLINNQLVITEKQPDKSPHLNNIVGSFLIIAGILLILWFFFQLFKAAAP
jgi:hypothetical protein